MAWVFVGKELVDWHVVFGVFFFGGSFGRICRAQPYALMFPLLLYLVLLPEHTRRRFFSGWFLRQSEVVMSCNATIANSANS